MIGEERLITPIIHCRRPRMTLSRLAKFWGCAFWAYWGSAVPELILTKTRLLRIYQI